jgi:hypothetical protein
MVGDMKKVLATALVLIAGLAATPVAQADPVDLTLTVDPSPSYAGTWTTITATDPDGSSPSISYSVDFGDGSTPVGSLGTFHHIYQAAGTYTVTLSATICGGVMCLARSLDEQILAPPTVTALVNGIPLFSNDPAITVADPLVPPVKATNQRWGVKSWPAPFFSTSFDMPIHLTLEATGIPDGQDVRTVYWSGFSGDLAKVALCGVGSTEIGVICSSGSSGPQSASSRNTFTFTAQPGDWPYPWHLELWMGDFMLNPQAHYSTEPSTLSDTAVFFPPSCGADRGPDTPYPCDGRVSNTGKKFTYPWLQGFQGSDHFIVKHHHHVVSKTKVSGTLREYHVVKWSCPRSGTYSLQVVGRARNDVIRKMYKWVVHCP